MSYLLSIQCLSSLLLLLISATYACNYPIKPAMHGPCSRQWPEVSDFVACYSFFRVKFSHVRVFFDSRNVQNSVTQIIYLEQVLCCYACNYPISHINPPIQIFFGQSSTDMIATENNRLLCYWPTNSTISPKFQVLNSDYSEVDDMLNEVEWTSIEKCSNSLCDVIGCNLYPSPRKYFAV